MGLENTFFAIVTRMKFISRWSVMRNSYTQNYSEHSMEVAMIAHALAIIGNKRLGRDYHPERIAVMGLYHDFTEIITGDLPTPVKYRNDKIKSAFKEIEEEAAQELLERLPEDLRGEYAPYLQESEWTPEEYKLVKAADKLSALIKCIEEQKAGNQEFRKAKEASEAYLRDMNCPEADIFCQEFLPHYYKTLDEL